MTNSWSRSVKDLAENIRDAEGSCVFLVGAGFSVSSGIPLAAALIGEISEQYPRAYGRAKNQKDYNSVMAELTPSQRTKLLNKYIEQARVNWAHLALAQMFKNNYIDRILTVNFDPLIVHACAMTNRFPAVYDLAISPEFKDHRIAPKSVFFLNGQHTGFATLNAERELKQHCQRLETIVRSTGVKRTWVVIGYSGDADPLLEILAQQSCFEGGLFWIGYDKEPSQDVRDKLLKAEKEAFFIGGQDADKFMTELAQELESFPPTFLTRPFDHLEELSRRVDFSTGDEIGRQHQKTFQAMINDAKKLQVAEDEFDPETTLLSGNYQDVITWFEGLENETVEITDRQKEWGCGAYIEKGNELYRNAKSVLKSDLQVAKSLWVEAANCYERAIEIKPNSYQALFNFGIILNAQASSDSSLKPDEAKVLYEKAIAKNEQALEIKPDKYEALDNLGCSLLRLYQISKEESLLHRARDVLEKAEAIKKGGGS